MINFVPQTGTGAAHSGIYAVSRPLVTRESAKPFKLEPTTQITLGVAFDMKSTPQTLSLYVNGQPLRVGAAAPAKLEPHMKVIKPNFADAHLSIGDVFVWQLPPTASLSNCFVVCSAQNARFTAEFIDPDWSSL